MVLSCRDIVFSYSLKIRNDAGASRHSIIVTIMNESDKVFGVVCTDKLHAKKHTNLVEIDWKAAGLRSQLSLFAANL